MTNKIIRLAGNDGRDLRMALKFCLALAIAIMTGPLYAKWDNLDKRHVAVLNLNSRLTNEGIDPETIMETLESRLVEIGEFKLVERSVLKKILEEQKLELSGLTENEATKIGKLSQADKVITGSLSKSGGRYVLLIKSVDVASGEIDISDQISSFTSKGLISAIPEAAERLLARAKGEKVGPYEPKDLPESSSSSIPAKVLPDIKTTSDPSILGYYAFNGTAKDYGPLKNDGIVIGPRLGVNRFNQSNSSYYFGTNINYITSPFCFSNLSSLTLSLWFKTDTFTGGRIAGFGDEKKGMSYLRDKMIYMNDDGQIFAGMRNFETDQLIIYTEQTYNDNNWHLATAIFTEKSIKLYLDDKLAARKGGSYKSSLESGYFRCGYDHLGGWPYQSTTYSFNGYIDEVRIYNRELTEEEILSIYRENGWAKE